MASQTAAPPLMASWLAWKGVSQYGLPKEGIPTVDAQAREAFLAKFLGPCDGKVGERIVGIAEQLG